MLVTIVFITSRIIAQISILFPSTRIETLFLYVVNSDKLAKVPALPLSNNLGSFQLCQFTEPSIYRTINLTDIYSQILFPFVKTTFIILVCSKVLSCNLNPPCCTFIKESELHVYYTVKDKMIYLKDYACPTIAITHKLLIC